MKKFQNRTLSKNNLIMDFISFVVYGLIFLGVFISLCAGGPKWLLAFIFLFSIVNRKIKNFCSDKISIMINGSYSSVVELACREIVNGASRNDELEIMCDGIAEYSVGDASPRNVIDADSIQLNFLKSGLISIVGKKNGEQVFVNIVEF